MLNANKFPVRCSIDQWLEQCPKPATGTYRQDASHRSWVNDTDLFICPGDPVPFCGGVGMAKCPACPGQCITLDFDWQAEIRVHPDEADAIQQGQDIWLSFDTPVVIDDPNCPLVGWAVTSEPTNGYYLGCAVVQLDPSPKPGWKSAKRYNGNPEAAPAAAGSTNVCVRVASCCNVAAPLIGTTPFNS